MQTSAQKKVLAILAKEWRTVGPPGIMDIRDVVAALSASPTETMAALNELFTNGLIDMNPLKTSAFLTPEGYDASTDN